MKQEWINVNNQKPQKGEKVFIICKSIGITIGYYWGNDETKTPSPMTKGWTIMDVSHWLPLDSLPEIPK